MLEAIETTNSHEYFALLLQCAGPVLFMALQASCVSVALEIQIMKSVKKLSAIPFACLLSNGVVWTIYGWLKNDNTILIPNISSVLAGAFCLYVFYKYSLVKPNQLYGMVTCFILLVMILGSNNDITTIGFIGCGMSILMSGSPLAVISTVIKEKSTAALPFWTSFITWMNTLSWVLYGQFIAHDPIIFIPNYLGLALASFQMLLFVIYGFAPPRVTAMEGELSKESKDGNLYNI